MQKCNREVARPTTIGQTRVMTGIASPELLASVERALEEHGIDAVTLEHIAAEAGVNRVTLYRQGHTRETLLTATALQAASEFRDAALPALTHPGTGAARLDLLLDALFDLADRHLALLAGLYDGPTAIFHLAVEDHRVLTRLEYTEPFARILADGVRDGTLTSRDPTEDAEILFNLAGWTYIHLRRSHGWSSKRTRVGVRRQLGATIAPRA